MVDDFSVTETWRSGESKTFEITITEDGSARDITNDTIEFYLLASSETDTANAIVDHDTAGVSVTKPTPADGRADVAIDKDTVTKTGDKDIRIVVDGPSNTKQLWVGDVYIDP